MERPLPPDFLRRVRAELPADTITTDPSELAEFGRDRTKVFVPNPSAIALPRTTEQVAQLVRLCREFCIPIVPSGGRTGLAGGAVATNGELVLSLTRMRRMDPIDLLGATVRVQAGAITQAVHQHCAEHGLTWPVDFASKGSSTVGGNIATNAGGVRVIRYGLTRQWVLGLQVVLLNGDVLELNGALEKNNTGVDLRQLFIGSEGTLGIVTEATLKLTRLPVKTDVFLFALDGLPSVLRLFREARSAPFTLAAFEFFTGLCLARVQKHRHSSAPFEKPATHYVLIEAEDANAEAIDLWITGLFDRGLVQDGLLAKDRAQAAQFWALREDISESLAATGLPHKNDVALPVAELEAFCGDMHALFESRYAGWEICLFGHIGDGNLHINAIKPEGMPTAEFHAQTANADSEMFELVRHHHGSISAEHGIGLLKKPYLQYSRTPQELALLRTIKNAIDPENLLNPGKIFDR